MTAALVIAACLLFPIMYGLGTPLWVLIVIGLAFGAGFVYGGGTFER